MGDSDGDFDGGGDDEDGGDDDGDGDGGDDDGGGDGGCFLRSLLCCPYQLGASPLQ